MEETYSSSQQERQWIDLALEGDLSAFNQLVLSYQDTAFRIAKWIVDDEASAEDIVQTVFLLAYYRIGSFRGHNFRVWLLRMVHNACMDKLRRHKRHPSHTLQPQKAGGEAMETAQRFVHPSQVPKATLIQNEACDWIEQCLRRLPGPLRLVTILIDLERFHYMEAATILGIPLGAVKSRLGQARACMCQILREEQKEPEAQDHDRVEQGEGKQRYRLDVGRDTHGIHGGMVDKAVEFEHIRVVFNAKKRTSD